MFCNLKKFLRQKMLKIKQFYELLVEDSLRREDVDSLSRENMKNLHEIMQSFRFSNVCYWSYLSRTFIEILLSIGLFLIYFCWGMPNLEREIECNVHGLKHTCVLPNHQVSYYVIWHLITPFSFRTSYRNHRFWKSPKISKLRCIRLKTRCLKITEKVSFNIASEAIYAYNFNRQK